MSCPVCASGKFNVAVESYQGFTMNNCPVCDINWWEPFRNPGPEFYERVCALRDKVSFVDGGSYDHNEFIANMPVKKGSLLDIGCGTGEYLRRIKERGLHVEGLDFDEEAINTARTKNGIRDSYVMSLSEFIERFPEKKFDVVTGFQVLEHVDNPTEFIGEIKRVLKPGGYVVLCMPNRERWVKPHPMPDYQYGAKGDYPPVHLTRWNRRSLAYILTNAGFEVRDMKVSPLGMGESRELLTRKIPVLYRGQAAVMTRLMNSEAVNRASGREARAIGVALNTLRVVRRLLLSVLALPVFAYGSALGKEGCFLYVVARLR